MKQIQKLHIRQKVYGAFLGVAIGDALGMPVETWTGEKIEKNHGLITSYLEPKDHKWFKGRKAGTWTDDTLFTLQIAESMVARGGVDINDLAKRNAALYRSGVLKEYGAGGSTRMALKNLADGKKWDESGIKKAAGNGVAMKVMPIGLMLLSDLIRIKKSSENNEHFESIWSRHMRDINGRTARLAWMTHQTSMAAASGLAQVEATFTAFRPDPERNFRVQFADNVISACRIAEGTLPANGVSDKLSSRMELLHDNKLKKKSVKELAGSFDGAGCYVYESLPFSFAAFLRNPSDIKTLYEVASAGGDTDSTASIVGGLLGAYNGIDIFPQHLIDGLWQKERIMETAGQFWEKFFSDL